MQRSGQGKIVRSRLTSALAVALVTTSVLQGPLGLAVVRADPVPYTSLLPRDVSSPPATPTTPTPAAPPEAACPGGPAGVDDSGVLRRGEAARRP